MGFDSFIGNRKQIDRIRTKLREGRFPHSLLFAGPQGVGKHTLAVMVAKALNCIALGPEDFCGECSSCRRIAAGVHPDVQTVTLEEDATRIKIAQIRALLSTLEMQPLEGRNKIFIIDPANLLNEESANCLLKGLEEPPPNSFFFLIAVNVHELLLTIRSRSQVYHFAPVPLDDIRRNGITDEFVVRWSQGSIGRAQSVDVAAVKEHREAVIDFLQIAVTAKDESLREMLSASAELSRNREDFSLNLGSMAAVLADVLYISEGAMERVVNVDIVARLQQLASNAPTARWIRVSEFLRVIENGLKGNANRQMLTDVLALVTAEIGDDIPGKSR